MKDRIKKYIDFKNISAGELASLLEVQRSNISHVLNGRNMPGAAFIEKLLISFPDLNARWLLTGIGEMTSDIETDVETDIKKETSPSSASESLISTKKVQTNSMDRSTNGKSIDKVVLLLSDGTFIDYTHK